MKRIEIVAPVYNRREITLQCLRSLSKINKTGLDIHVIIVDDGSTDGTGRAIKNEFPEVQILEGDGNLWFTEGTNVGVREALKYKPDYVLTMNDDQVFDSEFLQCLVETAEKNPGSLVGPLLLLWDTPHKLFQVAPKWQTLSGGWRHWRHQTIWTVPENTWKVELIVGNCLLLPASAIEKAGLMNSKRYPNFGDAEYTPRLRKKGWTLLIDPRARVFCQPNNTPAKITKMNKREQLDALILNLGHIANLRRRFYSYLDGAPNKFLGVTAYFVYFARVLLNKNFESDWADLQSEKELKEIFKFDSIKD